MAYKLSICIPTYNRSKYLPELLESIIGQVDKNNHVEICVSDNASEDNTRELIEQYKSKYSHIVYFRWPENMGADRNFLKVVEMARGEYCWLMGSDDRVEPGAIDYVTKAIITHRELTGISINSYAYPIDMQKPLIEASSSVDVFLKEDQLFDNVEQMFLNLGCHLGYISAQIVEKKTWDKVVFENDLSEYYNSYVHMFVIGKMIKVKPKWLYLHKKLIGNRGGNDSFLLSIGEINRIKLAIVGYTDLAKDVFGRHSKNYRNFIDRIIMTHVGGRVLEAKSNGNGYNAIKLSIKYFWSFPIFWIVIFPVFILPRATLPIARYVYRIGPKKWLNIH